jgi:hypothetical protein
MSRIVVFLSGEGMHPGAVRSSFVNPRFIARAQVLATEAQISPYFGRNLVDRAETATIWGIAVEVDGEGVGQVSITTDAGETLQASRADELFVAGDPEAVLAAALYWELSPAYTQRLREAAGVAAPEAEGGWESPLLESDREPAS